MQKFNKAKKMENIIGRKHEIYLLKGLQHSPRAEFVALYGRRRVGKTFLVNEVFRGQFAFKMTGVIDGTQNEQFTAFADAMDDYGYTMPEVPKDWLNAFIMLKKALRPRAESGEPCTIFIDELPAMDAGNSGVAKAVGYFWNQWASQYPNITLIICGSATSWMISHVIDSRGGLHERLTLELPIHPFCLAEVEEYLLNAGFHWNRHMILQTYMVFGGIPYHLSLLQKGESLVQNIDRMFFGQDMNMRREYRRLFSTLYRNPEGYMNIVRHLAGSRRGMTRQELAATLGTNNNGHLGTKLEDLVFCDLVRRMPVREKKIKQKDAIYQLSDFFCHFYLTFVGRADLEQDYWSHHINTPEVNTWMGLAYERIVMAHIPYIKHALGIEGISTLHYSWRSQTSQPGAQVDVVIERADQIVNLCEVKYSLSPYSLSAEEYHRLQHRMEAFSKETGLRHAPWITLITTNGLADGKYNDIAQVVISLDDFFRQI